MIKAILYDADGVVTVGRHKYFSDLLSEEYNIPLDEIMPFFKNEFGAAQRGQKDIKEVLPPYLKQWNWQGSIEDFLDYWYSSENSLNNEVLKKVEVERKSGIKCYLATDQEKYRAAYIMENLGLKNHFDGAFFSCDLGYKKSQPEFFQAISEKLSLPPDEIEYWDDDPENVEIAEKLGIHGQLFTPHR